MCSSAAMTAVPPVNATSKRAASSAASAPRSTSSRTGRFLLDLEAAAEQDLVDQLIEFRNVALDPGHKVWIRMVGKKSGGHGDPCQRGPQFMGRCRQGVALGFDQVLDTPGRRLKLVARAAISSLPSTLTRAWRSPEPRASTLDFSRSRRPARRRARGQAPTATARARSPGTMMNPAPPMPSLTQPTCMVRPSGSMMACTWCRFVPS